MIIDQLFPHPNLLLSVLLGPVWAGWELCREGQATMGLMRKTLIVFCLGSLSCSESFSTIGLGGTGLRQQGRGGVVAASQGGRATGWVVPHCSTLSGHTGGHGTLPGGLGDVSLSRPVLGLESGAAAGRGARALCHMCANDDKTGDDEVPSFLSGVLPAARQPLRGNSKVGDVREVEEEEVEKEGVGEPWPHGEGGQVEPREVFPKDPPAMDAAPAEAAKSQYPSPMWDTWREEEIRRSVWLWVNKIVVGLDLCPFALETLPGLRVIVSPAVDRDSTLDLVTDEMKLISTSPVEAPASTIIAFPPALFDERWRDNVSDEAFADEWGACNWPQNFIQFMHMATEARDLAQQLSEAQGQQLTSESLLLTFHPSSTFSEEENDPADFALRSPFPTLLLLRGVDVRRAEEQYVSQGQTTEDIAIGNEARLDSIGFEQLSRLLADVMKDAKKPRSANGTKSDQGEEDAVAQDTNGDKWGQASR